MHPNACYILGFQNEDVPPWRGDYIPLVKRRWIPRHTYPMQKVLGGLNTLGRRQSLSASKKIKTPPTAMASSTSAPQLSEKMSNAVTGVAAMKRIIVCCDGN